MSFSTAEWFQETSWRKAAVIFQGAGTVHPWKWMGRRRSFPFGFSAGLLVSGRAITNFNLRAAMCSFYLEWTCGISVDATKPWPYCYAIGTPMILPGTSGDALKLKLQTVLILLSTLCTQNSDDKSWRHAQWYHKKTAQRSECVK